MNRGLLTRSTTVTDRRIAAAPGPAAEAAAGEGRWRAARLGEEQKILLRLNNCRYVHMHLVERRRVQTGSIH